MTLATTEYAVYRWEAEDLFFVRRLHVGHAYGAPVTPAMVAAQVEAEIGAFPADRYRAVPVSRYVDFEVKSKVMLS